MNLYEISIMSLFDLLACLIISSKLMQDKVVLYKKKTLIKISVLLAIFSFLMGVIGVTPIGKYSFIAGIFITIIFLYLVYSRNFKETIYMYIISTIIILTIQYLVMSLFLAFKIDLTFNFKEGLIAQILILPVLILINKFIPLNLLFKFIEGKNRIFTALTLNMFIIVISILAYRYIEKEGFLSNILIIPISSFGLLFVNLVIIRNGLRNEYEGKMLNIYEKYLPVIDDLMMELRSKQHEFDNHIQAINMISVANTDYECIIKSMKKYIEDLDTNGEFNKLIKLDNKIFAGFLYYKSIKAKEYGINFQINIKDYGFKTNLKDYELIEVVGNLIDNAFESGVENNLIILEIKEERNMSVIEIKNNHSYLDNDYFTKIFTPGYSTKSAKNRGYGLPNINRILSKNNGRITVQNETIDGDNYVVFRVLLVRI